MYISYVAIANSIVSKNANAFYEHFREISTHCSAVASA